MPFSNRRKLYSDVGSSPEITGCGEWAATQPCACARGAAADKSNVIATADKAAASVLELFMRTDLLGWLMLASGVSTCPTGEHRRGRTNGHLHRCVRTDRVFDNRSPAAVFYRWGIC